jgi:hypothetical protein
MAPNLPNLSDGSLHPTPAPEKVSVLRWAFRFLRWSTYLATLVTILLLLHKAPAPSVTTTPQAAASAAQKFSQMEQSVSQGQPAQLRLDQAELNSYLANHLDLAPQKSGPNPDGGVSGNMTPADIEQARSSVRDVKVTMEGDQVHAYVVFDMHGKEMTLDLIGKIGAADGYLKFEPLSGKIGSLPIPQSALEGAVRQLMESPENREKLKLPSDISDLKVENGELVTTYH